MGMLMLKRMDLNLDNIYLYFLSFFLIFFSSSWCLNDAPFSAQMSFQDPATPVMTGIIFLYDYIFFFLVFILIFVTWMLVRILMLFQEDSTKKVELVVQNVSLEIGWTLLPAFLLFLIAGNSISHLYSAEELLNPALDVVIVGNQWFWVYEYMVFKQKITIESHMVETEDLRFGELRLLEVDTPLVLPVKTSLRLLVTSTDVIHSWAVPSLGVKVDAIPGRINETSLYIQRVGIFRGQCSEICGRGHAIMPIVVKVVNRDEFITFLHFLNYLEKTE